MAEKTVWENAAMESNGKAVLLFVAVFCASQANTFLLAILENAALRVCSRNRLFHRFRFFAGFLPVDSGQNLRLSRQTSNFFVFESTKNY